MKIVTDTHTYIQTNTNGQTDAQTTDRQTEIHTQSYIQSDRLNTDIHIRYTRRQIAH